MRWNVVGVGIVVLFASGCLGSGEPGDDSDVVDTDSDGIDEDSGSEDVDTDTNAPSNRAPVFLDFGISSSVLTDESTVVFTAVLTDPDGVDDIVGGTLSDAAGASYGAFATAASEGAYEIRVDWDDLNNAEEIYFDADGGSRLFIAEFFDQSGERVSRETTLALECDDEVQLPCEDGLCQDLDTVEDCGACGRPCTEEGAPEPVDWSYLATYNAIWCETGGCTYKMVTPYNSCNAVCGPEHECIRAYVQSNPSNYDIDCDDLANPSRVTLCECRRNEPYEG